jgi:hypothetical protein
LALFAALATVLVLALPSGAEAKKKKEKKASPASLKVIAKVADYEVTKGEFDSILKANRRFFDLTRDSVRTRLGGKKLDEYLFNEEIVRIQAQAQSHAGVLPQMKQTIEAVQQRLAAGADFAEVAREMSQEPGSAERGGELGVRQGFFDLVHPFNRIALSLKEGEVSEPVLTIFGYHIVKVDKIYPPMELRPKQVDVRHILIRYPGDPRRDAETAFAGVKVQVLDKKYCRKLPGHCEEG